MTILALYNPQFEYMFQLFYGMKLQGIDNEEFNSIYADLDFEAKQHYGDRYKEVCDAYSDELRTLESNE